MRSVLHYAGKEGLTSLAQRYALDADDIAHIRDVMAGEWGEKNRVFYLTPSGFHASLHYHIYSCEAAALQGTV